ncbi:MAG: RnfABCDGE type electron transport complex subunit D [Phycisphaerae bacterium]|nr:RnfABCDGE type electron transport complex subunit D [Phycisphaerae bacterium]
MAEKEQVQEKILLVSSSPHLVEPATSRRVMIEVAVGCAPAALAALYFFRGPAAAVLISCLAAAIGTEWLFNVIRKKPQTAFDGSVIVTALILGLSLPPTLPFWMAIIGTIVAVSVAKMLYGGLGNNIFNPAMMGRAFLMACFGMAMTTWSPNTYQESQVEKAKAAQQEYVKTEATPLSLAKDPIKKAQKLEEQKKEEIADGNLDYAKTLVIDKSTRPPVNQITGSIFMGATRGSLGETSALCWLIGGLFLLWRRTITWHIPVAVLGSAGVIAMLVWLINPAVYANPLVHLFGGGMIMCAFFIATDPVTCPLSRSGRVLFGLGVGGLIMLIRLKGGYPEGVMYAILLMNSMTPLLDRWTRPTPLGGKAAK